MKVGSGGYKTQPGGEEVAFDPRKHRGMSPLPSDHLYQDQYAEELPDLAREVTSETARAAFFEQNPRLHSILSTAQLSVPEIVDALRETSVVVKDMGLDTVRREGKVGHYVLHLEADKPSLTWNDAAKRLLARMQRNKVIREIKVTHWVSIEELTKPIQIGGNIFT